MSASVGTHLAPDSVVESLERRLGRALKRPKPGPELHQRDHPTLDLFEELYGNK